MGIHLTWSVQEVVKLGRQSVAVQIGRSDAGKCPRKAAVRLVACDYISTGPIITDAARYLPPHSSDSIDASSTGPNFSKLPLPSIA